MARKDHKKSTIIAEGQDYASKKTDHYVSKEDFFKAMCQRKREIGDTDGKSFEKSSVDEYIGQCIYKIADGVSRKWNFKNNQHYREELVGDAMLACWNAVGSFDEEKSKNPFAYFTQVCYFSFLGRIGKEHKQTYVRFRSSVDAIDEHALMNEADMSDTDISDVMNGMDTTQDYVDTFVRDYEQKNSLGRYKKRKSRVAVKEEQDDDIFGFGD